MKITAEKQRLETLDWIKLRQEAGEHMFLPPEGIYPFLHIEESTSHDDKIKAAFGAVIDSATVSEAMKIYNEWDVPDLCSGSGGNHIWFKRIPTSTRKAKPP